jgi:hypothetical protein
MKRENDGLNVYVQQLEREKSNFMTDKGAFNFLNLPREPSCSEGGTGDHQRRSRNER